MPPKIRELERQLLSAGFKRLKGKGSHRKYRHDCGAKVTISGKSGQDAKPYQIRLVRLALQEATQ